MKYQNGRIYVFHEDGWQIGDAKYGSCLCLDNKTQAQYAAKFARAYIRKHGDIDLGQFPFTLDTPLPPELKERQEAFRAVNEAKEAVAGLTQAQVWKKLMEDV
jgi:hypothetical protein